jgi:hypothetical protein
MSALVVSGCGEDDAEGSDPQAAGAHVSFVFAAQTGHTGSTVELTLVFDEDIPDLSTDDITVTSEDTGLAAVTVQGIVKAEEAGDYILTLEGLRGKITVSVSKTGYDFTPDSLTVNISNEAEPVIYVTFDSAEQTGSVEDGVAQIKLVFGGYILGLSKGDITVTSEDTGLAAVTVQGIVKAEEAGDYTLTLEGLRGKITVSVSKTGYAFSPPSREVSVRYSAPVVVNPSSPSIKEKFGIAATGTEGVTATFTALHEFIAGDGLTDNPGTINLGDWIDLDTLTVAAYNGEGSINGATNTDINPTRPPFDGYVSKSLRLIVVGINSFETGKGTDGTYEYKGTATQHVVFQFQNLPVLRRMNQTATNGGGYAGSEMQ